MLVSGADLHFVAAAVQSWSLPQLPAKDSQPVLSSYAKLKLKSSLAILLLAGLLNAGHGLIISDTGLGRAFMVWLAMEGMYCFYNWRRYSSVNKMIEVPLDVERVELIKKRFLALARVMPGHGEAFLEGWFRGVPMEQIKRRNVEQFVAYGFYSRKLEQLTPELQRSVAEFVCEVEEAYRVWLADGFNPNISFLAHLWEPLRTLPIPLCIHVGSVLAGAFAGLVLMFWGFRRQTCEGLGYWYRPAKGSGGLDSVLHQQQRRARAGVQTRSMAGLHILGDSASSLAGLTRGPAKPLVFIHGVGFGIVSRRSPACENRS